MGHRLGEQPIADLDEPVLRGRLGITNFRITRDIAEQVELVNLELPGLLDDVIATDEKGKDRDVDVGNDEVGGVPVTSGEDFPTVED